MATQLIRSWHRTSLAQKGGVITIGHFDGVHLGHQHLVKEVVKKAKSEKIPSIVITFEPHAHEFFKKPNVRIPRLSRFREKWNILSELGVDYVMVLKFNQKLANMSATQFVSEVLYQSLYPKYIMIGDDFHFGKKRQGDFNLLKSMGKELGFNVTAIPTVQFDGERVSSSRIRSALSLGDLKLAKKLLGHFYFMLGRVRWGDQLGRKLGFPTINIDLHRSLTPVHGIFSVLVYGLNDQPIWGAASVGSRPTVNGTQTLLEVHLLDFEQEVYGRYVKVAFCKKLRDEICFASIGELKEQIAQDVIDTKAYFNTEYRDE